MSPTWYEEIVDVGNVTLQQLEEWLVLKPRCDRVGIEWDGTFCDVEPQRAVFDTKSMFDAIGQSKQFMEARNKANPFEGIKREIFQNRAALKMCEMDRHCGYMVTQPPSCITYCDAAKANQAQILNDWKSGLMQEISIHQRALWTRELVYFADLCSGLVYIGESAVWFGDTFGLFGNACNFE